METISNGIKSDVTQTQCEHSGLNGKIPANGQCSINGKMFFNPQWTNRTIENVMTKPESRPMNVLNSHNDLKLMINSAIECELMSLLDGAKITIN